MKVCNMTNQSFQYQGRFRVREGWGQVGSFQDDIQLIFFFFFFFFFYHRELFSQ